MRSANLGRLNNLRVGFKLSQLTSGDHGILKLRFKPNLGKSWCIRSPSQHTLPVQCTSYLASLFLWKPGQAFTLSICQMTAAFVMSMKHQTIVSEDRTLMTKVPILCDPAGCVFLWPVAAAPNHHCAYTGPTHVARGASHSFQRGGHPQVSLSSRDEPAKLHMLDSSPACLFEPLLTHQRSGGASAVPTSLTQHLMCTCRFGACSTPGCSICCCVPNLKVGCICLGKTSRGFN